MNLTDTEQNKSFSPWQMLTIGYLFVIFTGTILLCLPISTASGTVPNIIDAFFTSTSAVCVTGLIVVDTGNYYSLFGQFIILLLIQVGGLGYMTMSNIIAFAFKKKVSLKERMAFQEERNIVEIEELGRFIVRLIKITLVVEAIGAIFLTIFFTKYYTLIESIKYGIFHSISAYCNAGFSLFSDSFIKLHSDLSINIILCFLIISGGLGYFVITEVFRFATKKANSIHISVHTKMVLITSLALILLGVVLFLYGEYNNTATFAGMSTSDKITASFFQSVTCRTAGFNTIDTGALTDGSIFILLIFMFIGASPGGTGGGIKTTTFCTVIAGIYSYLSHKTSTNIFSRRIPEETLKKAYIVFILGITIVCFAGILLIYIENAPIIPTMFETLSAFATVGLSMGAPGTTTSLCASYSWIGKLIVIITMFFGRVGPLTLGAAFMLDKNSSLYKLPKGNILIG